MPFKLRICISNIFAFPSRNHLYICIFNKFTQVLNKILNNTGPRNKAPWLVVHLIILIVILDNCSCQYDFSSISESIFLINRCHVLSDMFP